MGNSTSVGEGECDAGIDSNSIGGLLLAVIALLVVATPMAEGQDSEIDPAAAVDPGAPDPGFLQSGSFPAWNQTTALGPEVLSARGIAVDPGTGNIYVSSLSTDSVNIFNAAGTLIDGFPAGATPEGVTIHDGELFVAELDGGKIEVYDLAGNPKRTIGSAGSGDGELVLPCDVAVGPGNEVFVSDSGNSRVQVFTLGGLYLRQFGTVGSGPGQFDSGCPGMTLEILGAEVFVSDRSNDRVQVFALDGTYSRQWGSPGSGNGQFGTITFLDIAQSQIYVADSGRDDVQVFTAGGIFEGSIDSTLEVVGMAVDATGKTMWMTDNIGGRLQPYTTFACDGQVPSHVGTGYDDTFTTAGADDVVHGGGGHDPRRSR